MKSIVFLTLICLLVPLIRALTPEEEKEYWEKWKKQQGRVYGRSANGQSEEKEKFEAFKGNLEDVVNFNKNHSHLYRKGLNAFSAMTPEEKRKYLSSHIDFNATVENNENLPILPEARQTSALPESLDWEEKGVLAPIQNQGSCGSCYSFAVIAAVEAAYAIKYKKKPPQLSEQQIVDCSYNKYNLNGVVGNGGCNGGFYRHSLTLLKDVGARLKSKYPYTGKVDKCKTSAGSSVLKVTKIYTSTHEIGDVESIKAALNKGPLMAYIYADDDFMNYGDGIFTGQNCQNSKTSCPLGINHAVVLVGYGTTDDGTPFWKVRNSWSVHWGEKGYVRILMGENVCCLEGSTVYAEVK